MIHHDPCVSNSEVVERLLEDQADIKALEACGHPVRAMVSYHSETTMETHSLPVFESDTLQDLANRYADFFPKECERFLKQVEHSRQMLHQTNGMSDGGLMAYHCSIPQGLWVMIRERFPEAVANPEGFRRLTNNILRCLPKLRVGAERDGSRITV